MPAARRVDAERNRARLVLAAWALFGELGATVPTAIVARYAQLAPATVYRNFPSRDSLITEVRSAVIAKYVEAANSALQATDPWLGVREYFTRLLEIAEKSRRFMVPSLSADTEADARLSPLWNEARTGAQNVLSRARRENLIRADFSLIDLDLILTGCMAVAEATENSQSRLRYLELMLEGLSAPSAS